jgi:hypothetical protein
MRLRFENLTRAAQALATKLGRRDGDVVALDANAGDLVLEANRPPSGAVVKDWPAWALVAALFAAPQDRGIGDTIRRELGGPTSERFKRHHEAAFGLWSEPCGCGGKIEEWNRRYPYRVDGSGD